MRKFLEYIDFKKPDYSNIDNEFILNKIKKFINSDILKNIEDAKIYKEYEFIYIKDENNYHGIIDLMLEYDNHIDIIDYKLKHIEDNAYLEQLKGYKSYIKTRSNKDVNIYLYSIMDEAMKQVEET